MSEKNEVRIEAEEDEDNDQNNNQKNEENKEETMELNQDDENEFFVAYDVQRNEGAYILLVGKTKENKLILRLIEKDGETKPFFQNEFSLEEIREINSLFSSLKDENDMINFIIKNLNQNDKGIELENLDENNIKLAIQIIDKDNKINVEFILNKVEYIIESEEDAEKNLQKNIKNDNNSKKVYENNELVENLEYSEDIIEKFDSGINLKNPLNNEKSKNEEKKIIYSDLKKTIPNSPVKVEEAKNETEKQNMSEKDGFIMDTKISKVIEELKNNLDSLGGAMNYIEQDPNENDGYKSTTKNEDFSVFKEEMLSMFNKFTDRFNESQKKIQEDNDKAIKEIKDELNKKENELVKVKNMLTQIQNSGNKKGQEGFQMNDNNDNIETIKINFNTKLKEIDTKINNINNEKFKPLMEKIKNIENKLSQNEKNKLSTTSYDNKINNIENKIKNLESKSKEKSKKMETENINSLENIAKQIENRINYFEKNVNNSLNYFQEIIDDINTNDIINKVNNILRRIKNYPYDIKELSEKLDENSQYMNMLEKKLNKQNVKPIKKTILALRDNLKQIQLNENPQSIYINKENPMNKSSRNIYFKRSENMHKEKQFQAYTFNRDKDISTPTVNQKTFQISLIPNSNMERPRSRGNEYNKSSEQEMITNYPPSRLKKYSSQKYPFRKKSKRDIFSSKIVDHDEIKFIEKKLKEINPNKDLKINFNLIYRATEDGDKSQDFHAKCDKIGPNITIVKTKNGYIFGGFTYKNWEHLKRDINVNKPNLGSATRDPKAFGFSVNYQKIYNNSKPDEFAIWCNKNYGATFKNNFFQIFDECLKKGGYCNARSNSHFEGQDTDYEISGGKSRFGIEELEVFEVSF